MTDADGDLLLRWSRGLRPRKPQGVFRRTRGRFGIGEVGIDDQGRRHNIPQGEGVEQGDPIVSLMFSVAIHRSLRSAKEFLEPDETMFAILDDVHGRIQGALFAGGSPCG